MRLLRVVILIPSFRGGGAERAMVNLANGLSKIGHNREDSIEVSLLVLNADGWYRSEVDPSVEVHSLETSRASKSLYALHKFYNRHTPDVVISSLTHLNIVAILARTFAVVKPKIVVTERNTYSKFSVKKRVMDYLVHFLVGPCYRWADAIVAVSNGVATDLTTVFPLDDRVVKTIYNPVVSDSLKSLSHVEPQTVLPSVNFEHRFVLAAGSLESRKGFDVLIRAFALLAEKYRDVCLIILGEGPLREQLTEMAYSLGMQDRIWMPGFVANPFAVMRCAAVFVLSSRVEGLPNVLIQAMACGTQVIATDCPSGPSEILEGGKWGTLVPVDDVESLSEALNLSLDNITPRFAVEERAMTFSVDRAVSEYQVLIDSLSCQKK